MSLPVMASVIGAHRKQIDNWAVLHCRQARRQPVGELTLLGGAEWGEMFRFLPHWISLRIKLVMRVCRISKAILISFVRVWILCKPLCMPSITSFDFWRKITFSLVGARPNRTKCQLLGFWVIHIHACKIIIYWPWEDRVIWAVHGSNTIRIPETFASCIALVSTAKLPFQFSSKTYMSMYQHEGAFVWFKYRNVRIGNNTYFFFHHIDSGENNSSRSTNFQRNRVRKALVNIDNHALKYFNITLSKINFRFSQISSCQNLFNLCDH